MPPTWHPSLRSLSAALLVAGSALASGCTSPEPSESVATSGAQTVGTTQAPGTGSPSTSSSTRTTTAVAAPTATGPAFAVLGALDVPWSIAMLPDGAALVSVRNNARVYWIPAPGRRGSPTVVGRVPGVVPEGEGGLLGLAVAKDFAADPVVYAYFTSENDNRVAAIPWRGNALGEPRVILDGIPHASNHNGGRIAFGPDGQLYVATGDASESGLAQDLTSLGGKILRITPDGKPAPGNPFGGSPVWSYGHRNVQGLAWDAKGRLYASEFGTTVWDELNIIQPGRNYGWPEVEGRAGNSDYVDPIAQWRTSEASPSGITIGPDGAVYLAALRGESVWRVPLRADGTAGRSERHLQGTYGRIRDIRFVGGRAWILTNNGDDDRLLSLPLADVGAN
jgi:glucose/arabinose dehydrogenase